jgi:hypothetical protein
MLIKVNERRARSGVEPGNGQRANAGGVAKGDRATEGTT